MSSSGIMSYSFNRRLPVSVLRPSSSVFPSAGNITTLSSTYLPRAFAVQFLNKSSDVWIGGSGASCFMTNDTIKTNYVRPPLQTNGKSQQAMVPDREWSMSSGEPVMLCNALYTPG